MPSAPLLLGSSKGKAVLSKSAGEKNHQDPQAIDKHRSITRRDHQGQGLIGGEAGGRRCVLCVLRKRGIPAMCWSGVNEDVILCYRVPVMQGEVSAVDRR